MRCEAKYITNVVVVVVVVLLLFSGMLFSRSVSSIILIPSFSLRSTLRTVAWDIATKLVESVALNAVFWLSLKTLLYGYYIINSIAPPPSFRASPPSFRAPPPPSPFSSSLPLPCLSVTEHFYFLVFYFFLFQSTSL